VLQVYVSVVSNVCCKCFIWMLHMLQWLYTYVANVFPNVSVVLSRCCMFLSRCCTCCNGYTRMVQVYILNVSPISCVCYKCFIWMLLYDAVVIHICCKYMFQLFHLVSVCCSRCCSPRALTRGHARAARTHSALPISVMRART
jgi:hypothetical protein